MGRFSPKNKNPDILNFSKVGESARNVLTSPDVFKD